MSLTMGEKIRQHFFINQTDLLAPTAVQLIAPVTGFVSGIGVIVQSAVTTGGTIQAAVDPAGAAAIADVAGAVVTVADGATVGTIIEATSTAGSATRAVTKGDRVTVTPSAPFATAGAVNGYVEYATGQ